MASSPGSNASLSREKTILSESSQAKKSQYSEEESFYMNCRAAYLAVFKSSLENIKSKEQLYLVLQQAGRNPSQKTVNQYWTPQTTTLNFDDFCNILKKEKPATKTELLKAFLKVDTNNDGYILHTELYKILTMRGERMTVEEVNAITKLADVNSNGKLDYNQFCKLYVTTNEQCRKTALEKLEVDSRLRRQQFGSQVETSSERATSPISKPSSRTTRKTDHKPAPKRGDNRTSSRPSSAQSCKASVSSTISMGTSSNTNSELIEPNTVKDWQCAQSKGCFFLEEDGEIITHKYRLYLPQRSTVYITIKPLNLSQLEGQTSPWLSVDTALYVLKENESQENLQLMSFTEARNKEMFRWKGELGSGIYWLIPFTTGCRLKKIKKQITGEATLVYRNEDGELSLTKEFKAALSDIFEMIDLDGNGLLSLEEYNFFELRTSGEKCDEEAWAVCRENFDTKKNELTRQGFMDLNLMEANDREGDPSDLWVTLLSLGYNKALEMTAACPFVINIYAEKCKPRIKAIYLEAGSRQLNRAICKSVVNKGDAKVLDSGESIIVYTYKSYTRITSVIENKSENKVVIHVNNEQSKNCVNNRGLNIFAVEVAPKSMMVCQHVMPLKEQEEWIYNCVHSLIP
ncbi:EF-hand calcium-binding domain-containing protein 7 isoform X3 [Chelonia mydas]|uniref:EF-hand calcium-binding domain-containing protein 7 isoform X3 n=1 Tax=Chelonia mydas TaxID=8469 RepID=UPI0018A206F6|nr:EF-hand calcium-binding domain-containing protein 7 isoform X3 [Chelonia mydas]XP_037761902.1 EF-hand calcium-binding domain-containing protein 7 isoform X3 [Chelonia mydas]